MDDINKRIEVGCIIMFVFYGILFAASTHNTARFVVRNYRYQNLHILYFYILVYLITVLRVVWLALIYSEVKNYKGETELKSNNFNEAIYFTDIAATYFELLMGIQ